MTQSLYYPTAQDGLRVVVWNIARKERAWSALAALKPDICLLNEAIVPADKMGVWNSSGTVGRDGKTRGWTSAVISTKPTAPIMDARPQWRQSRRDVPFECSRPGTWAAASVHTQVGSVTAVALYGLLDEFSDASVHRSLSELSPIVDDPRYRQHVLLGGDLNTGTQWSKAEAAFNARDQNVLDRIAALGLIDCVQLKRGPGRLEGCACLDGESCRHVRTRRDARRPAVPYQTDYLFASRKLARHLVSCQVLSTAEWFDISDHAPIVADFAAIASPTRSQPRRRTT